MFWLRRDGGSGPRIGFTVGKVMGGAVVRNRMRRRTREAVRRNLDALPSAVDVVINPRKTVADAPFDKLMGEVRAAFVAVEAKLK